MPGESGLGARSSGFQHPGRPLDAQKLADLAEGLRRCGEKVFEPEAEELPLVALRCREDLLVVAPPAVREDAHGGGIEWHRPIGDDVVPIVPDEMEEPRARKETAQLADEEGVVRVLVSEEAGTGAVVGFCARLVDEGAETRQRRAVPLGRQSRFQGERVDPPSAHPLLAPDVADEASNRLRAPGGRGIPAQHVHHEERFGCHEEPGVGVEQAA